MADDDDAVPAVKLQLGNHFSPTRTYDNICQRRLQQAGVEAAAESLAFNLTAQFHVDHEKHLEAKRQKELEQQAALYGRICKQQEEHAAGARLLDRMLREEKSQVIQMITERRERREEEARTKEIEAQEHRSISAAHDLFLRHKVNKCNAQTEQKMQAWAQKLDSKFGKHNQAKEAVRLELEAKRKEEIERREARLAQAKARRERQQVLLKEKIDEEAEKLTNKLDRAAKSAEQHKEAAASKCADSIGHRHGRVQRLVQSARGAHEEFKQHKMDSRQEAQRRAEQARLDGLRNIQEEKGRVHRENDEKLDRLRQDRMQAHAALETKVVTKQETPTHPLVSSHSPKLQKDRTRAERDYVRQRRDIDASLEQMLVSKKFDQVSRKAGATREESLPARVRRLKLLEEMYLKQQ
mmetsp:Transcript_95985/g.220049  ORF Transcript_95985/g.220049 Transcript_95985/m.220049 type:complete len:410 (+) Transcript_95985:65-1294(+)